MIVGAKTSLLINELKCKVIVMSGSNYDNRLCVRVPTRVSTRALLFVLFTCNG